jgi:hypothetical protein
MKQPQDQGRSLPRLRHLATVYIVLHFSCNAMTPYLAAAVARPAPAIPESVSLQPISGRPDFQGMYVRRYAVASWVTCNGKLIKLRYPEKIEPTPVHYC